jgi:hypothetical protein
MKRVNSLLAAGLIMTSMAFNACEKIDIAPLSEALQADDEVASIFDQALNEADEISFPEQTSIKTLEFNEGNSGTRTVVTTSDNGVVTHTITYDNFVNGNSQFERVINGTMIITVTGRPYLETFSRHITLQNFTVNGILIEGDKQIEKTATNQFTITLTNGKVTFTDGKTYTRESIRTRTWVAGINTPFNIWDDEFEIEGEASGINRNDQDYTHTITNPLLWKRTCRWIVSGTVEMVVGENTVSLDYGDGECDYNATLTINGESKIIKLRGANNQ